MAKYPALLLWTDAYLADTTHLNTEEHGAYMLLLIAAWRSNGCSLPDDDELLARFCHCHPMRWTTRLRPILERFFTISDGSWTQKRLTSERKHVEGISEKRREASAKSREAKPLKTNGAGSANAPANDPPNGPLSSTSTSKDKKESPETLAAAAESHDPREEPQDGANAPAAAADPPSLNDFVHKAGLLSGSNPATTRKNVLAWVACYGAARTEVAMQRALRKAGRDLVSYADAVLEGCATERIAAIEAAKAVALQPEIDVIGESDRMALAALKEMENRNGQQFTGAHHCMPDRTTPVVYSEPENHPRANGIANRRVH